MPSSSAGVPLVSMGDLTKDRAKFFKDMEFALCQVGFMVLSDVPGLAEDFQEKCFRLSHAFFDLPEEQKQRMQG